ncbi:MAG: hypothetical protein AB9873_12695 [Syntrophobacteraceae bacterium]
MTHEDISDMIVSPAKGPLGWIKKRLGLLKPTPRDVAVSRASGNNGGRERSESAGGLQFTHTRVLPVTQDTFRRNRIVATGEMSAIGDQFKLLRTQIFRRTRPEGMNTIQISGFSNGEGKSLVAVNLAISIARDARQTTLLVDADFRNPSIHTYFGLSPELPGLKQHLLDGRPIEDILLSPGIDKLSILPAGGKIAHSTELIGSPEMERLVRSSRSGTRTAT